MPYPKHITLAEDQEKALVDWLEYELINHLSERGDWIDSLKRFQSDYIAKPATEVADYPFQGAAQIIIPLTAIAFEAVHSRVMQTLWSQKNSIAVKLKNPEETITETELEDFFEEILIVQPNFKKNTEPALIELSKLGTGALEATYCHKVKKGFRYDANGKAEEFEVTLHKGPAIESVPVANVLCPFDSYDIQTAPWAGKVFWLNKYEVKQKEKDGYFMDGTTEELKSFFANGKSHLDDAREYLDQKDVLENAEPTWPQRVEFYFICCSFDIADSGREEEIFLVYNRDTQKIFSCWYNWYEDLRRPIRTGVYFPYEYTWRGIGIGKQNEQFQEEITAQHRQRLDNASITNLVMFKVKRLSTIKPDEKLFPGKLWFLDDMEDVQPLSMGDIKSSAFANENQSLIFSQQRTGVTELSLGMPNIGTPGTAADSMARMQESARKFDYVYGTNIKRFLNESLNDLMCNAAQWGIDPDLLRFNPKGKELEMFMKNPYDLFRRQILLSIELVGQNQNRLLDRQNAQQLSSIVQQYYTGMLALIQQLGDPVQAQQAAIKGIEGGNQAFMSILETFDIKKPQDFLIKIPSLPNATQNPAGITGAEGGGSGTPSINGGSSVSSTSIIAPNATSIYGGDSGI